MYYCPECSNVFDITKSVGKQKGGELTEESLETTSSSESLQTTTGGANINELIDKILTNTIEQNDLSGITLDILTKSVDYKKLKAKDKEYVYNKLQDLLPTEEKKIMKEEAVTKKIEKAYFICNNCGYTKPIEEGTLIFSRVSSDISQNYSGSDLNDMKYSSIIPRTRKYLCPNKECESHTNPIKRDAVFFRLNNTFRIKYICLACGTQF